MAGTREYPLNEELEEEVYFNTHANSPDRRSESSTTSSPSKPSKGKAFGDFLNNSFKETKRQLRSATAPLSGPLTDHFAPRDSSQRGRTRTTKPKSRNNSPSDNLVKQIDPERLKRVDNLCDLKAITKVKINDRNYP
jgi:hypothetical protein